MSESMATALEQLKALFHDAGERAEVAKRGQSIPKDDGAQSRLVIDFLAPLFPPDKPGAGWPRCVQVWLGRIPAHRLAAFVRECETGEWKDASGNTVTWAKLDMGSRKRVVIHALNTMEGQLR